MATYLSPSLVLGMRSQGSSCQTSIASLMFKGKHRVEARGLIAKTQVDGLHEGLQSCFSESRTRGA